MINKKKYLSKMSEEQRYCPLCQKRESRSECSYGEKVWDKISVKDEEYSMARVELKNIQKSVQRLNNIVGKGEGNLEAWVQSKITRASDYIDSVADYLESGESKFGVNEAVLGRHEDRNKKLRPASERIPQKPKKQESKPEEVGPKITKLKPRGPRKGEATSHLVQGWRGSDRTNTNRSGQSAPHAKRIGEENSLTDRILEEILGEGKKKGLWDNIHAKRKRGESPAKPGEKGYPKTLDIEEGIEQARKNVGASKCWTGKKLGNPPTKIKGGKEVPNCESVTIQDVNGNTFAEVVDIIKPEPIRGFKSQVDESTRLQAQTGNVIAVTLSWRGKYYSLKMFFPQVKTPSRKEITDELQKVYPTSKVVHYVVSEIQPGQPLIQAFGPQGGSSSKPGPSKNYVKTMGEEVELDEGMTMKDFKQQRSRQKQKDKRAALKTSPTRRKGIHNPSASPERAARHRTNVDPDFEGDDESNYPGGKLKNPKKIRKARATGEISEAKKSEMPCNKPKAESHGSGETGKSHVVKACEGGKEKLIRFGQKGVKGSPKKEGESKEYASRRHRFQSRHAKNIAKGKMSAAYWANKVKW